MRAPAWPAFVAVGTSIAAAVAAVAAAATFAVCSAAYSPWLA